MITDDKKPEYEPVQILPGQMTLDDEEFTDLNETEYPEVDEETGEIVEPEEE